MRVEGDILTFKLGAVALRGLTQCQVLVEKRRQCYQFAVERR